MRGSMKKRNKKTAKILAVVLAAALGVCGPETTLQAAETQTSVQIQMPGFVVEHYTEHASGTGSDSKACAYIGLSDAYGTLIWGVGTDDDIITASLHALVSAVNRARRHG